MLMNNFWKFIADHSNNKSIATKLRRKRFALFCSFLDSLPRPIKILDVGGTDLFWEMMEFAGKPGIEITLLNISRYEVRYPNMKSVTGDARTLSDFQDQEFDVVFSNSVIEHVGDFRDQQQMAAAIQRVGQRYFLQTPNYHFPVEPHFLFPFFHFLPVTWRVFLLQHFNLGWYKRLPNYAEALAQVKEIRLLTEKELRQLFPKANLYCEMLLGLKKSFIVYDEWDIRKK